MGQVRIHLHVLSRVWITERKGLFFGEGISRPIVKLRKYPVCDRFSQSYLTCGSSNITFCCHYSRTCLSAHDIDFSELNRFKRSLHRLDFCGCNNAVIPNFAYFILHILLFYILSDCYCQCCVYTLYWDSYYLLSCLNSVSYVRNVCRILVMGGQCPLAAWGEENFEKKWLRNVHSEVYLNKYCSA